MSDAAEGTGALGTSETATNDLGTTSTEGAGGSEAAEGSAEEPILYAVKVNGQEEKVTFDELTNGYQRGRDHTIKTQRLADERREVAAERERLAQVALLADALERNPHDTVRLIAAKLGVSLDTAAQVAANAVDEESPWRGVEQRVERLTQQLTAREQAEVQAREEAARRATVEQQIQSEMAQLHLLHGDFPDMELIQYAADHGFSNLEGAYKAWQFDAFQDKQRAELNAATEAKRRAQVVGGGQSTAPNAVAQGQANGGRMDVRAAYLDALAKNS